MVNKLVLNYKDREVSDKILSGVRKLREPVASTMGPKGNNVIFEDSRGNQNYTNDGVTIAKNITLKDPIENAIVEIIKGSSLKTNTEVGDGTSSTILLSSILIEEGLKLIDTGRNWMDVKNSFEEYSSLLKKEISKFARNIKGDDDLLNIARISSNNDNEVANNVVEVIKVVGDQGQVVINPGFTTETEIIKDTGFIIPRGMIDEMGGSRKSSLAYYDIPVLITDKRLYYEQEAATILSLLKSNGYDQAVIIASDFIGEALPYFIANHEQGNINLCLIKETDKNTLADIATFLGGKVVSDKSGSLVNNLQIGDLCMASKVFTDPIKTIISNYKDEKNKELTDLIKTIKDNLKRIGNKNDPEYKKEEDRLASLTRGMVTIKVGGRTRLESIEKGYRYEDAISATRAALTDGYLVGGGVTLLNAGKNVKYKDADISRVFKKVTEGPIRQVVENSGISSDVCLEEIRQLNEEFSNDWGYNVASGKYEDLFEAGIIEPFKLIMQVIDNSVSIANIILTSRFLILNEIEDYESTKTQ